eukprot:scaffold43482_cov40-Cyclotella_meneghiniana.AAC.4
MPQFTTQQSLQALQSSIKAWNGGSDGDDGLVMIANRWREMEKNDHEKPHHLSPPLRSSSSQPTVAFFSPLTAFVSRYALATTMAWDYSDC